MYVWGAKPGCCGKRLISDNENNFDGDDFDDVEEDEGLDDVENVQKESQENFQSLGSGE
jgi:DNA-directed RNA polymerase I, II, and III subunit RPABC2